MVKVIVVDDHAMLREAWKIMFRQHPEFEVIGEAENGLEALRLCERYNVNIILMDIEMPVKNGLDATKEIMEKFPFTKVIIVSMYADENITRKVFMSGARGFITKNSTEQELFLAIKIVREGGKYLATSLQKNLIDDALAPEPTKIHYRLTKRELEIVKLILDGNSSKQIAEKLFLSLKTVECHRMNIYKKLGVKNLMELVKAVKGKIPY